MGKPVKRINCGLPIDQKEGKRKDLIAGTVRKLQEDTPKTEKKEKKRREVKRLLVG